MITPISSGGVQLSAMVVTPDRETIATLIESLLAQDRPSRIELVAVAPRGSDFEFGPELETLGRCTLCKVETIDELKESRAAGCAAASAPIVLIAETHCFPEPGWLDAVLGSHAEGWAVVGPRFENANPATTVSWANFIDHYARFWRPEHREAVAEVGGHNATLRRADLLALGDDLPPLLRDFPTLQQKLGEHGGILLEPAACMRHVNMSRFRPWMVESWAVGRVAAASRARHWSSPRRFGYALAWPLVALIEWRRRLAPMRRVAAGQPLPRGTAALLPIGIFVRCAGEALGFLTLRGGPADQRVADTETHRLRYVTAADRKALEV